jgi:hypothetical protein
MAAPSSPVPDSSTPDSTKPDTSTPGSSNANPTDAPSSPSGGQESLFSMTSEPSEERITLLPTPGGGTGRTGSAASSGPQVAAVAAEGVLAASSSSPSTSSPAASPARALRTPARALASTILRLLSGPSSLESWASFDPGTSRSRTWRLSALSILEPSGEPFSGTWPRWGMTWRGDAFELPTWEPRTDGTGSSPLLATPTAWLGRRPSQAEGQAERWHDPARSNELSDQMAAIQLLPTPDASVANYAEDPQEWQARAARLKEKHGNGNGHGTPLAIAVKLLPTPAGDSRENPQRTRTARRSDERPTQWTDPEGERGTRIESNAWSMSSGASTSPPSDDGKRSTDPRPRLSPEFVEWMMGTPRCGACGRGWTDSDCPHSATAFTSTSAGSSGTR